MSITAVTHENDATIKSFVSTSYEQKACMLQLSTVHLFQGQEQTFTKSDTMKMSSDTMIMSSASESTTMFRQGGKKWSLSDLLLASIIYKGCALLRKC